MTTLDINNLEAFFKLCKKNKVSEIDYQGVRVVFFEKTNQKTPSARLNKSQEKKTLDNISAGNLKEDAEYSDDEAENLHLTDPLAYEQMVLEGELESDRSIND